MQISTWGKQKLPGKESKAGSKNATIVLCASPRLGKVKRGVKTKNKGRKGQADTGTRPTRSKCHLIGIPGTLKGNPAKA